MAKFELGKRINDYLVKNQIPQKLLASKSLMTENQLNLSLNNKRKLLADEYIKICDALCVPYDKFVKPLDQDRAS